MILYEWRGCVGCKSARKVQREVVEEVEEDIVSSIAEKIMASAPNLPK